MESIKIKGVYTPGVHNFFVDSIAKYIRDNNYPNFNAQECIIIAKDGTTYNYLISRDDGYADDFKDWIEVHPEWFDISSDVHYEVRYMDFFMLIDGHYYWATT